jgi:hypothetical protein
MGGDLESVRMGAKEVSARWLKASRALKKEDQIYGQEASGDGEETLLRGFLCF